MVRTDAGLDIVSSSGISIEKPFGIHPYEQLRDLRKSAAVSFSAIRVTRELHVNATLARSERQSENGDARW